MNITTPVIKQANIKILAAQLFFPGGFEGFPPKFAENVVQYIEINVTQNLLDRNFCDKII